MKHLRLFNVFNNFCYFRQTLTHVNDNISPNQTNSKIKLNTDISKRKWVWTKFSLIYSNILQSFIIYIASTVISSNIKLYVCVCLLYDTTWNWEKNLQYTGFYYMKFIFVPFQAHIFIYIQHIVRIFSSNPRTYSTPTCLTWLL